MKVTLLTVTVLVSITFEKMNRNNRDRMTLTRQGNHSSALLKESSILWVIIASLSASMILLASYARLPLALAHTAGSPQKGSCTWLD